MRRASIIGVRCCCEIEFELLGLMLLLVYLLLVRWICFSWMTRLESRQRGQFVVVAEPARLKPASEASAQSELVIVVVSARLKPASEASAHSRKACN